MSRAQVRLNPVAQTLADLITPRQLYDVRRLAESLDIDISAECRRVLGCEPEYLSRDAAMIFTEHLQVKA